MGVPDSTRTLSALLRYRAETQPDATAFIYLHQTDESPAIVTYRELDRGARQIAATLVQHGKAGDRVLLLYPPGLSFIPGFFGCLYAHMIGVPAYPPRNNRNLVRLQATVHDADAHLFLTDSATLSTSRKLIEALRESNGGEIIASDMCGPETGEQRLTDLHYDALAILQYTSGSTSQPKGVMVSHANFMHQLKFINERWSLNEQSAFVSWLPHFHDMGLVAGVLNPLYGGFPGILMAPTTFLQRPSRWLKAISDYRATATIAPNFAYDLCVDKIPDDERRGLDLSCWRKALNGAEVIRRDTLERFVDAFAPYGFDRLALIPGYGLAEATLVVSSVGDSDREYQTLTVQADDLRQHRVRPCTNDDDTSMTLVGCGRRGADQDIVIVNPDTAIRCAADEVGEIWLRGPSVAKGYWQLEKETTDTFGAHLADSGDGPYLRTGDLGFVHDNELYITGRLKDVIIIHGANHYPQDVERTVQECHPLLRTGFGAAFAVEGNGGERLVVVQEVERHQTYDFNSLVYQVQQAIVETHGIPLHALVLIRAKTIPRTSSGKIRHRTTRTAYENKDLRIIDEWHARATDTVDATVDKQKADLSFTALVERLLLLLATHLNTPPARIDVKRPFTALGLDSMGAVTLTGDLEKAIGRELPASLFYDYPTIDALAAHLCVGSHAAPASNGPRPVQRNDAIAVIGIGCRFPGAPNPGAYWELLENGTDAVREVPDGRWAADAAAWSQHRHIRHGGFLEGIDMFDPGFFEISPREAASMDPQQRLLMEVSWEALEHAGIPSDSLAGSDTGVVFGVSGFDYALLGLRHAAAIDAYSGTGIAHSISANRLSYFLDLHGPSFTVDTACSSSLVAVHVACAHLRRGETDLMITGGVNTILTPDISLALARANMLAPDGRCKTFDSRADGYVRGEGCGVVVLKRLSDAIADGDRVHAVIRGSAVNQDGHSNGLTAPNGPAQVRVIEDAIAAAGIKPDDCSYVECHGTGTALGDLQEVEALAQVYGCRQNRDAKMFIGSVKTNIGHLEAAAGMAGLIKVVLALEHDIIPPHLHLQTVNPHIQLDTTPFDINTKAAAWPGGRAARIAGVSSFGFGGTNAHLIIGEAPHQERTEVDSDRSVHILTVSAKDEAALKEAARDLASLPAALPDLCYTRNARRSHFSHRLAIVGSTAEDMQSQLSAFEADAAASAHGVIKNGGRPKLVFLFTGQGSQYAQMGKQLYDSEPVFRNVIDRCAELLDTHLDIPLCDVMYDADNGRLDQTAYTMPTLFTIEVALAELWRSWGIEPDAVMGHSVGEFAAAYVAGVLRLEDALTLVAGRAALLQSLPAGGGMAAVLCNRATCEDALAPWDGGLCVAAENGPQLTIISGELSALEEAMTALNDEHGIRTQSLNVSHAFHSARVDPILDDLKKLAETVVHSPPKIPFMANVTGEWFCDTSRPDPAYWRRQAREPVKFESGIRACADAGYGVFLEIGPKPTLAPMAQRILAGSSNGDAIAFLSSINRDHDHRTMLDAMAQLHVRGFRIDWDAVYARQPQQLVDLPSYPFQRKRCWIEAYPKGKPVANGLGGDADKAAQLYGREDMTEEMPETELVKLASLNRLALAYMTRILERLGIPANTDPEHVTDDFVRPLGIKTQYRKLVIQWLLTLAATDEAPRDLASAMKDAETTWHNEAYVVDLVRRCGDSMPDILYGNVQPHDLLFPAGSTGPLEKLYRDSAPAIYYNMIVREVIRDAVAAHPTDAPLRILEIGAGTGGTTSWVLPELPADRVEYHFTDLSDSFLQRARERFRDFPFVQYQILNIEAPPEQQGIEPHSMDLVIAANVLHGTRDMAQTLAHCRSLLTSSGRLVLWEVTTLHPWFCIAFGILDGWQRFEDYERRPSQPLMSPDAWKHALTEQGFTDVETLPKAGVVGDAFGQHVISAKSTTTVSTPTSTLDTAPARVSLDGLLYGIKWKLIADAADASTRHARTGSDDDGWWLLLADRSGVAAGIRDAAAAQKEQCVVVYFGGESDDDAILVDPDNTLGFWDLLEDVLSTHDLDSCLGIIHLWSLDCVAENALAAAAVNDAFSRGSDAAIRLVQAVLAVAKPHSRLPVWFVTRGAQPVRGGGDLTSPTSAMLWGFGRVLALEHPELRGGLVDLDPIGNDDDALHVWQAVNGTIVDGGVARRGQQWYAPRLERRMPRVPAQNRNRTRFAPDKSYLITGGLGGVGLTVAEFLVDNGARHLLLLSRRHLPPRSEWAGMGGNGDDTALITQTILNLESQGAAIHLIAVDVADNDALNDALDRYEAEAWPPIRGIFHAAGILDDCPIVDLGSDRLRTVMRPKVNGIVRLWERYEDTPLQFCLLFSSAAAVLGSAGHANYIIANTFMDAAAHHLRARGMPVTTVNWGVWEGIGLADLDLRSAILSMQGAMPVSREQMLAALADAVDSDSAQHIPMAIDWELFLSKRTGADPFLQTLAAGHDRSTPESAGATPAAPTPTPLVPGDTESVLAVFVANLLQFDIAALDHTRPLATYGFDSIMAVQLRHEIEIAYGLDLSGFDFGTISLKELAERVKDWPAAQHR